MDEHKHEHTHDKPGCDLCGDFPVHLMQRCHPTAPLQAKMVSEDELVLSCYLPACKRVVARLKVQWPPLQ